MNKFLEGIYHHDRGGDHEDFHQLVKAHGGKVSPLAHTSEKSLFKIPASSHSYHDFNAAASDNGHTQGHHYTYQHEDESQHEIDKHGTNEHHLKAYGYKPTTEYYGGAGKGWHKDHTPTSGSGSRTLWEHTPTSHSPIHHHVVIFNRNGPHGTSIPDPHQFRSEHENGTYYDGGNAGDLRKLLKRVHGKPPTTQHEEYDTDDTVLHPIQFCEGKSVHVTAEEAEAIVKKRK